MHKYSQIGNRNCEVPLRPLMLIFDTINIYPKNCIALFKVLKKIAYS